MALLARGFAAYSGHTSRMAQMSAPKSAFSPMACRARAPLHMRAAVVTDAAEPSSVLSQRDGTLEPAVSAGRLAPASSAGQSLASVVSPRIVLLFNGRLAMLGLFAGVAGELLHQQPLGAQLTAAGPAALAWWTLLLAATLAPLLRGEEEGDEIFGPFRPEAEMLNGQLAILGVLALLAIEAIKGTALF